MRIIHDYCRRNKIHPKSSDEESPQSTDNNKSNQITGCDFKLLQLKTDKMEVSVAEIKASNAEIRASNAEIKGLLEDLLKGRSSK